jgi:hypothetical protein
MVLLSPITVKTLRDTDGSLAAAHEVERGRLSPVAWLSYHVFGDRPAAYKFSTSFSVLSVLIVVAALVSGLLDHKAAAVRADHRGPVFHQRAASAPATNSAGTNAGTAADTDKAPVQTAIRATPEPAPDPYSDVAHALAPFAYGAMGACVFLLRSLHKHIWARTFDRRRKPEYYSRVLLGAISGGTIVLLLTSEASGPEGAIKLGYNALGFLAGYNTDLLFSTIERIMNAILPKTATTAPASPTPILVPPGGLGNLQKKLDDPVHPKDGDGSGERAPDNKASAGGRTDTPAPAKDAISPGHRQPTAAGGRITTRPRAEFTIGIEQKRITSESLTNSISAFVLILLDDSERLAITISRGRFEGWSPAGLSTEYSVGGPM